MSAAHSLLRRIGLRTPDPPVGAAETADEVTPAATTLPAHTVAGALMSARSTDDAVAVRPVEDHGPPDETPTALASANLPAADETPTALASANLPAADESPTALASANLPAADETPQPPE